MLPAPATRKGRNQTKMAVRTAKLSILRVLSSIVLGRGVPRKTLSTERDLKLSMAEFQTRICKNLIRMREKWYGDGLLIRYKIKFRI